MTDLILTFDDGIAENILRKEYNKRHPREIYWTKGDGSKINIKDICWFYNNSHQQKTIGFLNSFDEDYFWADNGKTYKFCRPVRRDEVTFYEDKKDEQD